VLPPLNAGACVALLCVGPAVLARASALPGACGGAGDTAVGAASWPGGAPAGGGAPQECRLSWVWRGAGPRGGAGGAGEPALGRTTAGALAGGDALAPALLATVRRRAPAPGARSGQRPRPRRQPWPRRSAASIVVCCLVRAAGRSRSRHAYG